MAGGVVEYIDTMEEETTIFASSPENLHAAEDGGPATYRPTARSTPP